MTSDRRGRPFRLSAALFAAKAGKRTLLVTKGSGVLAIGGGTIDVLGYRSDGTPLTSPFDGFDSLSPRHPYAIVGAETVKKALSCFLEFCDEGGCPYLCNNEQNTRVVTALGTTKPSYLVPHTMSMHGVAEAANIFIAGVEGLKDFSPALAAQGLATRKGYIGKNIVPSSCRARSRSSATSPPSIWPAIWIRPKASSG